MTTTAPPVHLSVPHDWLPDCFKTARRTETHISGFVSSEEELQLVLECHSRAFSTNFIKWCADKNKKARAERKRRLLWKAEDFPGNIPISINSRSVYTCQYGKRYFAQTTKATDVPGKKRRCRKSKKVDCPAKLFVRHITRYDKFRVSDNVSRLDKESAMSLLGVHITKGGEKGIPTIHLKLPLAAAHENHPIAIKNEFIRNVHPAVRIQFRESMASPEVKNPLIPYFVGVDCGTSSVRAALVSSNGIVVKTDVEPIKVWNPKEDFYEQSSEEIWRACCKVIKNVSSYVSNDEIHGIGFDATCSLVVLDEDFKPVSVAESGEDERNIIMWMDHRAKSQTKLINETKHTVLSFVGGTMSIEMQPPKLLWLKQNLPQERWKKAAHFFDLADFLSWKASGSLSRSLCTLVCKWTYQADGDTKLNWDDSFWEQIGLEELIEDNHSKIGNVVQLPGQATGEGLTKESAEALGLKDGTAVAVSLIDAHAGGVGMLGADVADNELPCEKQPITNRLALILGTSSCHMAVSERPLLVPGVWGPYFSAMVSGLWLNEGGQSITGKLIDHMIETHPAYQELKKLAETKSKSLYDCLLDILGKTVKERGLKDAAHLTKEFHIWPDHHGNRSPLADPSSKGMICGLTLGISLTNLAVLYIATIQSLAFGTKHILETLASAGHSISTLFACGGLSKNPLFLQVHADVTGTPIVLPKEKESVLVGSSILGACAAGYFENMQDAMETMSHVGGVVRPNKKLAEYYKKKYQVFRLMCDHQLEYRRIMDS